MSLPLDPDPPPALRAADAGALCCPRRRAHRARAERALHWPRERTVFVADVHLGEAAAFRARGVPLPRGSTVLGAQRAIPPAFGSFTGAGIMRESAERIVAISGSERFALSMTLS